MTVMWPAQPSLNDDKSIYIYIYIQIYTFVCVCVCVWYTGIVVGNEYGDPSTNNGRDCVSHCANVHGNAVHPTIYIYIYIYIRGAFNKVPDFFLYRHLKLS